MTNDRRDWTCVVISSIQNIEEIIPSKYVEVDDDNKRGRLPESGDQVGDGPLCRKGMILRAM